MVLELVQGKHSRQNSFFAMLYEQLVLPDHLLRRIAATVDFDFVSELVCDCYCPDTGHPSWDPLILFKVVFLQFLYDLSDREIEEQVNLNLACKWFAGLQPVRELAKSRRPNNGRPHQGQDQAGHSDTPGYAYP